MRKNLHSKLMLLLAAVLMGVGSVSAADKWVKTAPADLQTGDIVVIVDQTSVTALPNNNGASSAPTATEVTLSTDKSEITGDVASTLQWKVTVTNGSYQFGVGDNFLYCTNTNNGVRVGSNANNAFTIFDNEGVDFLVNTATSRYIGVFDSQDWRCYTSINDNIKNSVTAFYKKTTASGPVDATVTISSESIPVGQTATISGPEGLSISYESNNTQVATVEQDGTVTGVAAGEATITATWAATNDYNAGSAEFTITVLDATTYEKVTNTDQLVVGNEYILVATENNVAMGAVGSNIRDYVEVTIDNDKVSITDEAVAVLTLGGISGAWTFLASDNDEYLAYSGNSNQVYSNADATAAASQWTITNDFQLESANVPGRVLKYNASSPRFACYAASGQTAVLFVKSGSATDTKAEPGFSFSETSAEATLGTEFTAPTFSNPNEVEVTFASSDEDVATVDADGVVTLVYAGTTTITATSEATDTYKAGSASYTLTVIDPNAAGTVNNPYTVAQAIEATPTTDNVYIRGIVSSFYNTSIVGDGSNYRYYISDDGTTTSQLLVYKGKGLNEAAFTNADDLLVGDEVVICGTLTMYQNAPEIASGNYLYSWNRPTDTTPSITLSTTTIQAAADGTDGTINVTYENITNVAAEVQFCDAKGEEATYDWVDAEIDDENNLYYTIAANEGAARTAYMKVYALDDEANDVYSELITITQDAYVAPGETEDYELFTGDLVEGDYIIYYNGYAMKNAVENSRLMYELVTPKDDVISTGDATIVWHLAKSGDYWTIYNADADAYAAGTGVKNKAQMLADGTDDKALWTVSGTEAYEFVNKKNAADGVNANLRNNGTYGFACYATATGGALSLYKKVASVASVTVTDAGWATYIAEDNVTFPSGVAAYIATKYTESSVTLTEVLAVPEGTPVIVNAEAGTYELETVDEQDCDEVSDNMFIVYNAKTTELEDDVNLFVLAKNASDGSACFKQWIGDAEDLDGRVVLPLELDLNSPNGVRALSIVFGGETTGIETVSHATPTMSEGAYTLSGQRVQKPTKGLYIIGGKKVVVK